MAFYFGYSPTSESSGDSTQLLYLRARYYNPDDGRFTSRDIWTGYENTPITYNHWFYANANPVMYTDPSGQCIFTGIDTLACIIALAVGIPVVAGVTTAAWNYSVNQGEGLGGANWGHPECADWGQVASAGGSGFIAAFEKLLAIPLAPDYVLAAFMGKSPTEANALLLSYIGLQDEYLALQGNPYFVAGGYGGQAGATYISAATFIKGLPTSFTPKNIPLTSPQYILNANGQLVLVPGLTASIPVPVGGSTGLISVGTSGLVSSSMMMSPDGGGGGGFNLFEWLRKKPFEGVVRNSDGTVTIYQVRKLPGADGGWSRIIKVKDANGNTIKVIHEAWSGTSDPRFDPPDHSHVKFEK